MIRPKQQESKASIKPVSEMSPQGTSIYINTAKTLQNYLTNCIISKRSLEFYLKKTFENDQALSEYNFYKEIDPIKLKIIIETMLKNIKSEYRNDPRGGSPNRRGDANSTELAEDYKQRLRSYLGQINSMVNSIKATKKAEFNLFKYILKEVLPTIKSDQIKNDIQFIIQENANLEGILDTVNRETEQFNQELAAASFADFNITQESAPSKSPEREMTIQEDDAPQQKTISKKMSKVMDDQKTESKNDPFENKDRRELNDLLAKADSSTIQKFLNDLKTMKKSPQKWEPSVNDLQLTINLLKKENDNLSNQLKEQTEDLLAKLREANLDKEILQKEFEEKKASFELLKKKGFVEKDNPNISLLETANKLLETERNNLQAENQGLMDHIKNMQGEHEEMIKSFQDDKAQFLNEKESLLKTLRAIEAEHEKSKKFYQTKLQEKELNYANTVKAYEEEIEAKTKIWEEERAAYAQEIEDRSSNTNDEKQKILARLYDKEKELQELQEVSQKKLVDMTKELQNTKETLLAELKESNKYKEKLNEILNENFQFDQKCNDLLKEKKELECELQELSIRLKLSQETFQRELYGAENRNKTENYEMIQKLAAMEEKYRICKAKNENLIEENQHLHSMLLKYSKSPRQNVSKDSIDLNLSGRNNTREQIDLSVPGQERINNRNKSTERYEDSGNIQAPSILGRAKSPKSIIKEQTDTHFTADRVPEIDKFLVSKQERPYKDGSNLNPKDFLGFNIEPPNKKFSIEPVRYPLRHPTEVDSNYLEEPIYNRNGGNDNEMNFGLNRELSRTEQSRLKSESSIQIDPLNRSGEDYKGPQYREGRKDPSRSFTMLNTVNKGGFSNP